MSQLSWTEKLKQYGYLIRFDKPIGTLLLLWPTMWALWMASAGHPPISHVIIFALGTWLMRSAGCAVNDFADKDFDLHVKRTQDRPLTSKKISSKEALAVAGSLALISFALVWPLNYLTKLLSVAALAIAIVYPYTKRFFSMPQAVLGVAFGFGIPMAYAAELNQVPWQGWLMLLANIFWAIAYDTAYAMVDRDDDLKLGIKTSAITFGKYEVTAIMLCYAAMFALMAYIAIDADLNYYFWSGWLAGIGCAMYHYTLIKTRDRMKCFKSFMHNNWLGACLFAGIFMAWLTK
jgi:4-hydroxybenzoate polyprenyltransferase